MGAQALGNAAAGAWGIRWLLCQHCACNLMQGRVTYSWVRIVPSTPKTPYRAQSKFCPDTSPLCAMGSRHADRMSGGSAGDAAPAMAGSTACSQHYDVQCQGRNSRALFIRSTGPPGSFVKRFN